MKIPATIQVIEGRVTVLVQTRVYAGEIRVYANVEDEEATLRIPGFGPIEHGQQVYIEITPSEDDAPKRDPARFNSPNNFQGDRNVGKELRSHVPSGTRYSDWP